MVAMVADGSNCSRRWWRIGLGRAVCPIGPWPASTAALSVGESFSRSRGMASAAQGWRSGSRWENGAGTHSANVRRRGVGASKRSGDDQEGWEWLVEASMASSPSIDGGAVARIGIGGVNWGRCRVAIGGEVEDLG